MTTLDAILARLAEIEALNHNALHGCGNVPALCAALRIAANVCDNEGVDVEKIAAALGVECGA